jgi:hypothetical protein
MAKKKNFKPLEPTIGAYFPLPWSVMDSKAWIECSPKAKALLMELCRQHNFMNNGHLQLCRTWLHPRGWRRPATVLELSEELIRRRLIIKTRYGGLNNGPNWFALTWLKITDFVDLNITERDYHPGAYLLPPLPETKEEKRSPTPHVRAKAATRTGRVREVKSPSTSGVREKALLVKVASTPHVHNEYIPMPTAKPKVRVTL